MLASTKRLVLVYMGYVAELADTIGSIGVSNFFWFDATDCHKRIALVRNLIRSAETQMYRMRLKREAVAPGPHDDRDEEFLVRLDQYLTVLTPFKSDDLVAYEIDGGRWIVGRPIKVDVPAEQEVIMYDGGASYWDPIAGRSDYREYLLRGEPFLAELRDLAKWEEQRRSEGVERMNKILQSVVQTFTKRSTGEK